MAALRGEALLDPGLATTDSSSSIPSVDKVATNNGRTQACLEEGGYIIK